VEAEARELASAAEVTVITATANGLSGRSEATPVVYRLDGGSAFGWPGLAARVREQPWRIASVLGWMQRVRSLVASLAPFDRIVCHWAVPSALPLLFPSPLRRRRGVGGEVLGALPQAVPLEIVSHGADVRLLARLPPPARQPLLEALVARAVRWRFVSASLRDELLAVATPAQALRLASIACVSPALIEVHDVKERSSSLRQNEGAGPLYVVVGRLVAGKRFDRALDQVASLELPDARVVVVGDGPERRRLEARARTLGVDARFVGKTSREEALAWIAAADGLFHASKHEGLSTVVREAEALGVPVHLVP
jgi:glycosyltransferase involved in cell wall biosynthesis